MYPRTLINSGGGQHIHSHLEKGLRISEIYSPVSLIRVLRNIRPKYSKVIQLQKTHFYNFQNVSKAMKFCGVPYSKVKELLYVSEKPFHVQFKTSFADKEFTEVSIRGQTTRNKDPCPNVLLPMPKNITKSPALKRRKRISDQCWNLCHFKIVNFLRYFVSWKRNKKLRNVQSNMNRNLLGKAWFCINVSCCFEFQYFVVLNVEKFTFRIVKSE